MAKKNPTKNNLKQGQTLYVVSPVSTIDGERPWEVLTFFLHSHKSFIGSDHDPIDKLGVKEAKQLFQPKAIAYFSLSKATTRAKKLNKIERGAYDERNKIK